LWPAPQPGKRGDIMKKLNFEISAYLALMMILSGLIWSEARRNAELQAQTPLRAQELYRKIAQSQVKLQIVDVRPGVDGFEDTHIPGAIPLPGCDLEQAQFKVKERVFSFAPTVIVSKDGNEELFRKCRPLFATARNLAGGMDAWVNASYPEDSGEYVPPRATGGGCL